MCEERRRESNDILGIKIESAQCEIRQVAPSTVGNVLNERAIQLGVGRILFARFGIFLGDMMM
jgi:hypothetical protein